MPTASLFFTYCSSAALPVDERAPATEGRDEVRALDATGFDLGDPICSAALIGRAAQGVELANVDRPFLGQDRRTNPCRLWRTLGNVAKASPRDQFTYPVIEPYSVGSAI